MRVLRLVKRRAYIDTCREAEQCLSQGLTEMDWSTLPSPHLAVLVEALAEVVQAVDGFMSFLDAARRQRQEAYTAWWLLLQRTPQLADMERKTIQALLPSPPGHLRSLARHLMPWVREAALIEAELGDVKGDGSAA